MHASAFDRFHAGHSLLHRLDPRVKVVLTVAFILSTVLLPDGAWLGFLLSWALVLGLSALSGLGVVFTFRRSFIALPFALAGLTAIFAIPGTPLAVWSLGPWTLVATDAGLLRFVSIVLRSWLSVQVAVLLVATTPFPDVIHALGHLHVPRLLVAIISFMYRYMFVLVDESMRLLRAREARSARLPARQSGGALAWRARVAGNMVGQLFLRSYERSERIYNAMLARGFQGQMLTLNPHSMRSSDWLAGILACAALLAIQILSRI
jgi:cobalt/nickel transport system permease protein